MSKTNKIWLRIASIISWIFAAALIFLGLCFVFDFFGLRELLEWYVSLQVIDKSSPDEVSFVRFFVMAELVFACCINVYAGVLYWSLSKKEYIVVGSSRVLVSTGLFQGLFTGNIFSATIVFFIANSLKKSVWDKKTKNNHNTIAYQIEKLRLLKEKGVITEEEWEKSFNELLSQYSNEKDTEK